MSAKKQFLRILGLSILTLVACLYLMGTTQTVTVTGVQLKSANGYPFGNWMQYSYTFVNSKDTMICNITPNYSTAYYDTMAYQLYFGLGSKEASGTNSDSVTLAVRYGVSWDNTNWKYYTIGTDSTTWIVNAAANTLASGGQYIWVPQQISVNNPGLNAGKPPYTRIMIYGYGTGGGLSNAIGTRVKLEVGNPW